MLIRFSVENYKSFRDRVEFSMVSSKVRSHPSHVVKATSANDISVLKVGVIYGANASGKSNIIKAMKHAQNMILKRNPADLNLKLKSMARTMHMDSQLIKNPLKKSGCMK